MADGSFLSNVVDNLICKLCSSVAKRWKESLNVRDDFKKLVQNLSEIKAVLMDAEEKQSTTPGVKVWLDKLKVTLYDAEDLVDVFSTEDLRQVMSRGTNAEKVSNFFSSSNPLTFSFIMFRKIKKMRKRIEALNDDSKNFNFKNGTPVVLSYVHEGDVIGREEEKEILLKMLLNISMDVEETFSIISIVGYGGLGKTALAQLLYNDKEVQDHFELKMWVHVSDDEFDVKAIASKIIKSKTDDEMDEVQQELRDKIGGRRYLLVLDDLWDCDHESWLLLRSLLMGGAKGSKIIVTTRSEKVAKMTGPSSPFQLKGLDEEKSWKLFSKIAFGNRKEPENEKQKIGKEIVGKCSGYPLVIRKIGCLMYYMTTVDDWLNFRDNNLVKKIVSNIPFHLKKCISFCSLFPRDYVVERKKLIQLWVAQGFVEAWDESICLEDVGNEYFMNLADRSFFQDLEKDVITGETLRCKMHDLVHDLIEFVDGVIVTQDGQHIDKETRHLSFRFPLVSRLQVPGSLLKACKLRTFLLQTTISGELKNSICYLIMSSFEQLRVLDLSHSISRIMPTCIGRLKHLRYLDLSRNAEIEVLPESLTKLHNLQTLLLSYCSELRELPKDLCELRSLRHLELEGCDKLSFMPRGIGQLTNLQTLTLFVFDKTSRDSGVASELRGLNNLRGSLQIKGLEWLRRNATEAKDVDLLKKSHLQDLELTWDKKFDDEENDTDNDFMILEGLLPDGENCKIKCLTIRGFGGVGIPNSFNSFSKLVRMSLIDCTRLQYLPRLHLLPHLIRLSLADLPCLEWISNDTSLTFFPSLEEIYFDNLVNLKGWCRCNEGGMPGGCCHQFKSLHVLHIHNCPNLISIPQHTDIRELLLQKVSEKMIQQAVNHSKVEILEIKSINDLKSLSGVLQHLTALRKLHISGCEELDVCNDEGGSYSMQWRQLNNLQLLEFGGIQKTECLPEEGLQHLTTLKRLTIWYCENLRSIPEGISSLTPTLEMYIHGCPKLTSLPDWIQVLD